MYKNIALCFDMAGCPNNCLHCWIKKPSRAFVKEEEVKAVVGGFKKLTETIDVYAWYLEPDYLPNYKDLWKLENSLSTKPHEHFELLSDWRIVRDPAYLKWAQQLGVKKCQVTFFGLEDKTNTYTQRPNAFRDLLTSMDMMIDHGIAPRVQIFIYEDNVHELQDLQDLLEAGGYEERCRQVGLDYEVFSHTGSCVGRAMDLYQGWLRHGSFEAIPQALIDASLKHYKVEIPEDVYGYPEDDWVKKLSQCQDKYQIPIDNMSFYIDGQLRVYPYYAVHDPWWCLGSLKEIGPEDIVKKFLNRDLVAQEYLNEVTLGDLAKDYGDSTSDRVFIREDYIDYLVERYLRDRYHKEVK